MHEFMLLAFAKMHNELVDSEWAPTIPLGQQAQEAGLQSLWVLSRSLVFPARRVGGHTRLVRRGRVVVVSRLNP